MIENPFFDNTRLTDHGDYVVVEWDHNGKRIQNVFYRDQIVCQRQHEGKGRRIGPRPRQVSLKQESEVRARF
jgi:hypothetical protein